MLYKAMLIKCWALLLLFSPAQSASTSAENHDSHPCTGEPTVPTHRRACNMYTWDIRSALLYKWCHHLLKDHVYEGRGGKKFVRFESNSILQLLYPCSRYSPNRCIVCGGSFPDHLELWWSKHLYTPFDRVIDRTYKEGVRIDEGMKDNRNAKKRDSKKPTPAVVGPPRYAFHRHYVEDVNDLIEGVKGFENQMNVLKKKLSKDQRKKKNSLDRMTLTRFQESGVAYLTPELQLKSGKRPSWALRIARGLCLINLEYLVGLQENENEKLRNPAN
eukprot:scaffold1384_cov116-Cylindrotheca_fusiformis.AAC.29